MFLIINFDGWNVGCADDFTASFLTFHTFEEAQTVVEHWNDWLGI